MVFIGSNGFYDSKFYYVFEGLIFLKGNSLKIVDVFKGVKK
ncbi:hypothetical protein [Helicobacter sp. WB40]|nr:hypothetical protein [Helicobacter sp. WB40]MDA3966650.1 hypothetical protein [Helicobacter sp. WB40]